MSAKKSGNELQSLLQAITELYSDIISNVVHNRISAYNPDAGSSDDVGAALHAYIVRIKHSTQPPDSPTSAQTEPVEQLSATYAHAQTAMPEENGHDDVNSLSQHLQKNNLDAELATPIGHKLSSSAWNHTHSAIRCAHQGDYAKAKLYADLANNAIHELGHYVSVTEFTRFKQAVKAELLSRVNLP